MISPETRAQIRRYFYAEHWKVGTIAAQLGVHPDAVRNAIETQRLGGAQPLRPSIVDPEGMPVPKSRVSKMIMPPCFM